MGVSRYTHSPTANDIKAIDRVSPCIASTPEHGLLFASTEVDAFYGNHADRKLHSGCTRGNRTFDSRQYNLRYQSTDKVTMGSNAGNLFLV